MHFPCDRDGGTWRTVHAGSTDWTTRTCLSMDRCPPPQECGSTAGDSAGICGEVGGNVECGAGGTAACTVDIDSLIESRCCDACVDDPDGVVAALGSDCTAAFGLVHEDCEYDVHNVPECPQPCSIPAGTPFHTLCPVTCGVCGSADAGLFLGGHTISSEYGLHFDGLDDWATVQTPEYGLDTTWTYSLWFSKAECNPNAQVNWEYMLAHSASENSDVNLAGVGTPGGDDNVHMYLGCRPNEMSENTFWRFTSYVDPSTRGPPGNMIRMVMQDSAGGMTLTDLPLSATLEEMMMGGWNHIAFSMSPTGWVIAVVSRLDRTQSVHDCSSLHANSPCHRNAFDDLANLFADELILPRFCRTVKCCQTARSASSGTSTS